MKKFKYYIISIVILLICNINYAISRHVFRNKNPNLTETQLKNHAFKTFIWDHSLYYIK